MHLRLVKKGLLELPLHFDFGFGVPGAMTGTIEDLLFLVKKYQRVAHGRWRGLVGTNFH